jgi:hypothetical protein
MKELILRAGRVLKYRVIHRAQRYGVRHACGWLYAEVITGSTVAKVEQQIEEVLAPLVQGLSVDRIAAGFRLPENFGDHMRQYLRQEYRIIDRATGKPVSEKRVQLVGFLSGGLVNSKQVVKWQ